MALPASGLIRMSQVDVELTFPASARISLNQSGPRTLASKPSGRISMSDLRGKSNFPAANTPSGGQYCSGFTLMQNYHDGSGGTYSTVVQSNSPSCGYVADTTSPSMTISISPTTVTTGGTSTFTFTASEPIFGFTASDVVISGGLSNLSGSGTTYTSTWTPPIDGQGSATFNVPAGTYTDAAGNPGLVSNTAIVYWDTRVYPTLSMSASPQNGLGPGQSSTITLNFSENVILEASPQLTGGGITSFVSGSGNYRTFTFVPPEQTNGSTFIAFPAGSFRDTNLNYNTTNYGLTVTYNTVTAPPPPVEMTIAVYDDIYQIYYSDTQGGTANCFPSVEVVSGGVSPYTYNWTFISNPGGFTMFNGNTSSPRFERRFIKLQNTTFSATLQIQVTDQGGIGVSKYVTAEIEANPSTPI